MAGPAFDEEHRRVLPPRSLAIAAVSTIVEWYDFTLYLYFATVLSRVFYGGGGGSLLLTLGGFAIAYLMRPLGALFFSHIGDRRGRRRRPCRGFVQPDIGAIALDRAREAVVAP